jgi:hypothetical protein
MRKQNEKRHMALTKSTRFVANPIHKIAIAKQMNANNSGTLLSYRETIQPEIGRPIKELIGMASRMVPNSASFNPKLVLMVGIREAQLEKQKPERKKKTPRKIRCLPHPIMSNILRKYIRVMLR